MIYSHEEKLRIVKRYLRGIVDYPPNATPQQKNNILKKVKKWVGVYKKGGAVALKPKNHEYSYNEKKAAVERILNGESKYEVMFSMGMLDSKTLRRWVKSYEECGWIGLESKNRGKYFLMKKKNTRRVKTLEEENIELKKENQYLRAQVDYLKKLDALVSKRKGQQTKKNF
ncbi:MAG: helix-turn-helix domain-containing protein [Bacilli bacterium]|nr:helix-turn-helix domain-containing protein [Bacilli bacterium]